MKHLRSILCLAILALSFCTSTGARAQVVGVKTNLLYDATATFNLGVEVGLAPRLSLDISGNFNPWTWKNNMKWKHWMVQPELRLWTCQRFAGHFFALHALAGQFNVGNIHIFGRAIPDRFKLFGTDYSLLSKYRHEGWAFGGGLAYGYALPLAKHWNMEFEIGAGAIYSISDSFECDVCNRSKDTGVKHLRPAITKAALSIVYVF